MRADQAGRVEGDGLRAAGPKQPLELQRERGFRGARLDPRQQRRECPVGDRAGGRDPLHLGRLLDLAIGLDPAFDRDQLDVRRGLLEPPPQRVRHEPGLDSHPLRPDRRHERSPFLRQVVPRVLDSGAGRLLPRLDRVARVGQDDDVAPADEELAGVARDLLLALAEYEPREVARVLAADAEVGLDAVLSEPRPNAGEPGRPGRPVRLGPTGVIGGCRRCREVGGARQPRLAVGHQ